MKLLLDTHAFIWLSCEPERLPAAVVDACEDPANEIVLSVASILEMEIKIGLGKLDLQDTPQDIIATHRRNNDLQLLPIGESHAYAMRALPLIHRDPFDRILVAQTLVENAVLVTSDDIVRQYPVATLWE